MADPEITAALEYMNQVRTQHAIEIALATPLPAPLPTAADAIAARTWADQTAQPPLTPDEIQAAVDIIERAAATEERRTLTKRVPIEGSAGGASGRGGTGASQGGAGLPGGATGPAFGEVLVPHPKETAREWFLRWLLEPDQHPEPQVHLHPKEKLAAVSAALNRMNLPGQRQRLLTLQAWYYFQARALQAQGL